MLALTACSGTRTVQFAEDAAPGLGGDIDYSCRMPGGHAYTLSVQFYHDGTWDTLGSMETGELDGETELQIGGTGENFIAGKWSWKLAWTDSLEIPAPEEEIGSPGAAYDKGESGFEPEAGKEYLLCYVAGLAGNQMDTSLTAPFAEWSTLSQSGREDAMAAFSYVYLVTLQVAE